jgi:hypothetical protein
MTDIRSFVAIVVTATAIAAGAAPPVAAQAACDWYGRQALKQQQDNLEKKCGFTGAEWSADMKAHMTWCTSVAPDVSKKAAQSRDAALAGCQLKK